MSIVFPPACCGLAASAKRCALRLLFVGIVFWITPEIYAQGQPAFDVDVVSVRTAEGQEPRLDIYTAVPNSSLRFVARGGGFEAAYTVRVDARRADGSGRAREIVASRAFERQVSAPNYSATQRLDQLDRAAHAVPLAPGRYVLSVRVEDRSSRQSSSREIPITVRSFDAPVAMSDPLLLDRYDAARNTITPNVQNVISNDQDRFTVFYEIYSQRAQAVRVIYEVVPAGRSRTGGSAVFQQTETVQIRPGRNPATLALRTERFPVGEYRLRIRIDQASGGRLSETEKTFAVRWGGLDAQIRDLDGAIAQLRYIARDSEIADIQGAPSASERLSRFLAFWERRDPTPGSRRNERMEEYYFRVSDANERFGRADGWRTDRGEVFIRFGEPDHVERRSTAGESRPHEVWHYRGIGRQFIFVDQSGAGDFRLLIPIWDERTRM
ncbi:hypothetical protein BH23BAC4_BH23BAC4_10150 [soil metagenome]